MPELLECVPNFSEGRNTTTINAIANPFKTTAGVHLLDVHSDPFHNRSVLTVVGSAPALEHAVFDAVSIAVERIDLNKHAGQHPRMGAADVIPFISLPPTSTNAATRAAVSLGERLSGELDLPVYLYGYAARRSGRTELPSVRRHGFEWLRERLPEHDELLPDLGPRQLHPTAGASAVGARDFLVAFNVLLDTTDVTIARAIAAVVRTRGGGPPGIRALAFEVDGRAQVSMNLYDLAQTTPRSAYDVVRREAISRGVSVHATEVVGLMPEIAAADLESGAEIGLSSSLDELVLERRLRALHGGDAGESKGDQPITSS